MHEKLFSIQIFQYFCQIPPRVCTLVLFISNSNIIRTAYYQSMKLSYTRIMIKYVHVYIYIIYIYILYTTVYWKRAHIDVRSIDVVSCISIDIVCISAQSVWKGPKDDPVVIICG